MNDDSEKIIQPHQTIGGEHSNQRGGCRPSKHGLQALMLRKDNMCWCVKTSWPESFLNFSKSCRGKPCGGGGKADTKMKQMLLWRSCDDSQELHRYDG